MTLADAFEIAKQCRLDMNRELFLVWGQSFETFEEKMQAVSDIQKKFGYSHGWFRVGDFTFSNDDLVDAPTYDF